MAQIRKRATKWQARIRIKGQPSVEKSFITKADAEAWAKLTESEMIRGVYIKRTDAERTTLSEALDRYEAEVTPTKRGAAIERFRLATWRKSRLAQMSLASLRGADFARWRDERLKKVAPATVKREFGAVCNLFNVARKEWGFDGLSNPIESIRLPREDNARSRIFFEGEERILLQALDPKDQGEGRHGRINCWIKPIVEFALETAMRRGEILALRRENINLADQVALLPLTKNGASRHVPLTRRAVKILLDLPHAINGQVFPITANALKLAFVRAVARARKKYVEEGGMDDRIMVDLHFHDLRHIAITRLAGKLPNVIELAAVSGHSDVRMLRRYYHPKAADLAKKLG
jgi:integrase